MVPPATRYYFLSLAKKKQNVDRVLPPAEDTEQFEPFPVGVVVYEKAPVQDTDEKVEEDKEEKVVPYQLEDIALPLGEEVESAPETLRSVVVPVQVDVLAFASAVKHEGLFILVTGRIASIA